MTSSRKKKKKNGGRAPHSGRGRYRSDALAQGSGAANTAPFPIARRGTKRKYGDAFESGGGSDPGCLDAFCTSHLPLPRAVAPYLVVRVTSLVITRQPLVLLGPMMTAQGVAHGGNRSKDWCNQVGVGFGSAAALASGSVFRICLPQQSAGFNQASLVPAAFTVQVMNPNPLQTTEGIIAMGRLKLATTFSGPFAPGVPDPTVQDVAANCISYYSPRLMSAAKVAMRGVQTSCIPVDMNDISEFTPYDQRLTHDEAYVNTSGSPSSPTHDTVVPEFAGFAPIFISNPSGVPLNLLVSVEYRTRFDPSNPATAGAIMHKAAPTATWDKAITGMVARGNGVVDIAEKVVEYGSQARKLLGRAGAVAGLLM